MKKFLLILVILITCVSGCKSDKDEVIFKFKVGDIVSPVLEPTLKGMVIAFDTFNVQQDKAYKVRFFSYSSRTQTHLLESDDKITKEPFDSVWMYEFELKTSD